MHCLQEEHRCAEFYATMGGKSFEGEFLFFQKLMLSPFEIILQNLKVSKPRKQFMVFSILPKKQTKLTILTKEDAQDTKLFFKPKIHGLYTKVVTVKNRVIMAHV